MKEVLLAVQLHQKQPENHQDCCERTINSRGYSVCD